MKTVKPMQKMMIKPPNQNQRRWKGGSIEPHPTDKALIVNYQLEATVFGEPNNPMLEEKKVSPDIYLFFLTFYYNIFVGFIII